MRALRSGVAALLLGGASPAAWAQKVPHPGDVFDTLYVRDFSYRPTLRLYASTKFNSMVVRSQNTFTDLRYRPNGRYNIGFGVSYRKLTLNIAVPMPFVNNDDDAKGHTKYIDAQGTFHTQLQATNFFLQVFKGYHITSHTPAAVGWEQPTAFPYRPDLQEFNVGLSTLLIANHERFSYRATFNQDAWQQRSQGTWLYGGYATCYVVKADSGLVPTTLLDQFTEASNIRKGVFLDIGPMGGYAYTLVYHTNWFLTGSGAVGAGLSSQQLHRFDADGTTVNTTELGPGWHVQFRAGVGYNSRYRYFGILYNQEHIGYVLRAQNLFRWDVGNFRIMVVQRLRDRPKRVDRGMRWLRKHTALPVPDTQ